VPAFLFDIRAPRHFGSSCSPHRTHRFRHSTPNRRRPTSRSGTSAAPTAPRRPISWAHPGDESRTEIPGSVLNIHARAAVSRALTPLGARLAGAGVTPDAITVFGTVGAVASAVIFFPRGWFFAGTLLIWAFVMLDVVDGAVARAGAGGTAFGGVLDSTCDRIADAAVFATVAWYYARHGQKWMLLAALLCLVLGSVTSYIRARAEAAGLTATVGIAERAERLIIVL